MKKLLAIITISVGMMAAANANIVLAWSGLDGFVKNDGVTPLLDGGGSTVAILIYSPSGAFYNTDLVAGSHTIGDEVIWGSVVNVLFDPVDPYGFVPEQNYAQAFQAGFIYARIFDEGTTANPNSVTPGLWYYQGPIVATINNTSDPVTPDNYNMNQGTAGFDDFRTDVLNRQVVVPEPSTLAFLGLGGLALALRRRMVA
ncbi:MAG TPA: PEP-CTERM sorting domain-containing protein [Kiritimatiellia bacterium]|nr:PEP-CTERM sorting domain-containing protein [Kiritimatiellia bacterium]HMP00752.1 PEP-CTERM sorting domain-containing protein [Kiritimatiellia bacterium]